MQEEIENTKNKFVYLDIKIGNEKAGRVIIELFYNIAPITSENFRCLTTGERGIGKFDKPLHYKNSTFHRIVPCFLVQGGDIINGDGTGGESIYGPSFHDESFDLTHEDEGIVGMANKGPGTNSSQFYITTVPCSHLDGQNVAFGKVRRGLNVIKEMEGVPRNEDNPLEPCIIEDCGELKLGEALDVSENDCTGDIYPPWPDDWEVDGEKSLQNFVKATNVIKESGNYFFDRNQFVEAHRKYKKALRYIEYLEKKKYPTSSEVDDLKIASLLNFAAVKLKKGHNLEVIDICNKVLKPNPNNKKALYRRAKAKMGLNDYNEALEDFNMLLKIYPDENKVKTEIEYVMKLKHNYLVKEKVLFGRMFKKK